MKPVTYYRFDYIGFDGTHVVQWRNWRLSIRQALAKFKYTHRFHTMKSLVVNAMECGHSGFNPYCTSCARVQ